MLIGHHLSLQSSRMMAIALMLVFSSALSAAYAPAECAFSIKLNEEVSNQRITSMFLLPDEILKITIVQPGAEIDYDLMYSIGRIVKQGRNQWSWKAPHETGLYILTIHSAQSTDTMKLNVFVMVPYSALKGEYLNGYRIGKYPAIPFKQLSIYKPPRGFIEVTPENESTFLTPHFQLNQFLCRQAGGYPKYIVLRERLLLKLETILKKINEKDYAAETFNVLSGYRTPYYNKVIGNVRYSRHNWGGAADIFIDENPKDGMMDDLNRDGKNNWEDAKVLYDIIDEMYGKPWYAPFVGGLGRYKKTDAHGPFVHVDVRGFHARWGD